MHIFLISGFAGAGKSTVANYLKTLRSHSEQTAFAKHVKNFVSDKYDIERTLFDTQEGKKTIVEATHGFFTVRDLLILHAEAAKRKQGEGIWAETVVQEIQSKPDIQNWIIEDWRFPIEYDVLRKAFEHANIHRIRVENKKVEPYHKAEQTLYRESMNCIIDNTMHNCMDALVQFNREMSK
jgi:hypothetical protein